MAKAALFEVILMGWNLSAAGAEVDDVEVQS